MVSFYRLAGRRSSTPATGCIKDPQSRRTQRQQRTLYLLGPGRFWLRTPRKTAYHRSVGQSRASRSERDSSVPCVSSYDVRRPGYHIELLGPLKKERKPCDMEYVRSVSKKNLLGLDLLHQRGIVHTDLKPADLLFSTAGIGRYDELLRPPVPSPVERLEEVERDDSAPEYLVSPQQRRVRLDDVKASKALVQISDLGGALRSDQFDQ